MSCESRCYPWRVAKITGAKMKVRIVLISAVLFTASSCSELMTRSDQTDSDLKSELSVLRKRVALVEKKNAILESENAEGKVEIRHLKNDYAELKKRSDMRIRELVETNEKQKASFNEAVNGLKDESRNKEKDLLDRLAAAAQEAEKKENELSRKIAGLEKTAAEKAVMIAQNGKMIHDLEEDLSLLKAELKKRNDTLALNDKKIKELLSEIEKTGSDLEKSKSENSRSRSELDRIKSQLEEKEAALQDSKKTIEKLKSEIDSIKASNKEHNP
jgi:chromosome segregation ATPase